jgi:hypothetical protein
MIFVYSHLPQPVSGQYLNQNLVQEEIKSKLSRGNSCYHSVQNFLSFRLLSKNLKLRVFNTVDFTKFLYEYET